MERSRSLPSRSPLQCFGRRRFSAPCSQERPATCQRDWDCDWDCERVADARTAKIGLDVWGLIDRRVDRYGTCTGTSLSSSALIAQPSLDESVVDGDIWNFVNDDLANRSQELVEKGVDGDIWSFLSRDMQTSRPPPGYSQLLAEGYGLSSEVRAACHEMAWWSNAKTNQGASIFILAPRDHAVAETSPSGSGRSNVNMRRLVAYSLSIMHEHVVKQDNRFVLIWVQFNTLGMWPLSAWKLKNSLHAMYVKNVDAVHIVHPSWTIRVLELSLCVSSISSLERVAEKVYCHERVQYLARYFDLKALALPSDLYEYDDFLDMESEIARRQAEMMLQHGFEHLPHEYDALPFDARSEVRFTMGGMRTF